MKEIVVVSGKGGTGKTSITASLAALMQPLVLADCDVDAADLHLLLHPVIEHRELFFSGKYPVINMEICTQCGVCRDVCHYHAISETLLIDPISCEGCAVCAYVCPENAIQLQDRLCGEWFQSTTRFGPMMHARLGVAQENSGRLVGLIRKMAREQAERIQSPVILIDGPPGVGCPVISSMTGTDLAVVVTEPTVSGLHDLERILDLCNHFKVPAVVILNKADIFPAHEESVQSLTVKAGATFLGTLPYDSAVMEAMIAGKTVIEYADNLLSQQLKKMSGQILQYISNHQPKKV